MITKTQLRANTLRGQIIEALAVPCVCGECATDEDLKAALALSDEALVALYEARA